MPRVIHFDLNVEQPERAIAFYSKVFGWTINKWDSEAMDYWLVSTGPDDQPGINGGIGKAMDNQVGTHNTIEVPSVDEFATKIVENGGKVLMPKRAIPGVGYFAYCEDTEGIAFGIMQPDPSAK